MAVMPLPLFRFEDVGDIGGGSGTCDGVTGWRRSQKCHGSGIYILGTVHSNLANT
jgi:hypothetical protein